MKKLCAIAVLTAFAGCVGTSGPLPEDQAVGLALTERGQKNEVDQALTATPSGRSGLELAVDAFGGSLPQTVQYVAEGERFAGGESYFPGGVLNTNHYRVGVEYDLARGASRQEFDRRQATFGTPGQAIHFAMTLDGSGVGEVVGSESFFGSPTAPLLPDGVGAAERELALLNPVVFLREAQVGARVRELAPTTLDGRTYRRVDVTDAAGRVRLYIDQGSGRIAAASTLEARLMLRDTVTVAVYHWARRVNGQLAPTPEFASLHVGEDWVLGEHRVDVTTPALPASRFAVGAPGPVDAAERLRGATERELHQGFASLGILRFDGRFGDAVPTELSPGVILIGGSAYNSLLVEQADALVLIEAPLNEAHSEAILRTAAAQFPNKRIETVIVTHHHDDHSGGLRRFVAEGARIIASEEAAPFLAEVFSAPSAVLPDQLERAPRQANIVTVGAQSLRLPDSERPLVVAQVANGHSAGMLAVVLPRQATVFESDLWDPPFPPVSIEIPAWMRQLEDFITRQAPATRTIVPCHGFVSPRTDLQRALSAP